MGYVQMLFTDSQAKKASPAGMTAATYLLHSICHL